MSDDDVQGLVRRLVREDDPRAVAVLYDTFAAPLHGFLIARFGRRDEAEDVLQQLFLDLARRPDRILSARRLGPWLFAKARNMTIDRIRARAREARATEESVRVAPWVLAGSSRAEEASADDTRLAAAVARLPAEQREVLALKVFQGRTFAETAELLGLSANTAASRYRYAVEKLREWMGEDHDEP
jgi:RNA polymerase sigma-70 factor, ECF subfamily